MGEAKRRRAAGYTPLRVPDRPGALFWIGAALFALALSARFWLLLLFLVILWLITPARAHSFYPLECCSDQDCWPTGTDADAREPDPIGTASGWLLQDGTIVPYTAARPSPDGRFHVCRHGGVRSGDLIKPSARPPCLWAPVPGS